jgi:hypothetical protein
MTDTNCKTISVPEAGRIYFGMKPHASYRMAKKGLMPTIRLGRKIRVSIPALEKLLEAASTAEQKGASKEHSI